jgi:hypothetical protein
MSDMLHSSSILEARWIVKACNHGFPIGELELNMRLRGGKQDETKTPNDQTAKRSRRLQGSSPEFKTASPTLLSGRKKMKPRTPAPERTMPASPDIGRKTARVLFDDDEPTGSIDTDVMKHDVKPANHISTQGADKPPLTSNKPGDAADTSKSSTQASSPIAKTQSQTGAGSQKSQIPSPRVHFASSVTRVKLAPGEYAKSTATTSSAPLLPAQKSTPQTPVAAPSTPSNSNSVNTRGKSKSEATPPDKKSTPQTSAAVPLTSSNSNTLNVKGKTTPAAVPLASLPDKTSTPQKTAAAPSTKANTLHDNSKTTQKQTKEIVTPPPNMPHTTSPHKYSNKLQTPIKVTKAHIDAPKTDPPSQKDGTNNAHSTSPVKNNNKVTKSNDTKSPLSIPPQSQSTPQTTTKGQDHAQTSGTDTKARTPQSQPTPKGQSHAQVGTSGTDTKGQTPQPHSTPKSSTHAQVASGSANYKARTPHKDDKISENIPLPPVPSDFELALQDRIKLGIINQAQADALRAEELELRNNPEYFKQETEGMTDYLQNDGTQEVS